MSQPASARSPAPPSVANGIPKGASAPLSTLSGGRGGSSWLCPHGTRPPSVPACAPEPGVASPRLTAWDQAWTALLQALQSCASACHYVG
jgi:hypothetical protein